MNWKPLVLVALGIVVGAGSAPPRPDQQPTPEPASAAAMLDVADPAATQLTVTLLNWGQKSRPTIGFVSPGLEATGDSPADVRHALQPTEQLRSPLDQSPDGGW